MFSVVVPAHNEEAIIERCLRSMLRGAEPGEMQITVAANGCTDRTEEIVERIAASEPMVRLLRCSRGGKVLALNEADEAAGKVFPRLYVDADVQVDVEALRAVAAELAKPGILAAAPRLAVDLSDCSAVVKAYYSVWMDLPWVRAGIFGSGFYALSAEGRARFDAFPETMSEDMWVRAQFTDSERASVADHTFVVSPPRTASSLLKVRTRIHLSHAVMADLLASQSVDAEKHRVQGGYGEIARDVRRIPALALYLGFTGVAKVRGKVQYRRNAAHGSTWVRDDTARAT